MKYALTGLLTILTAVYALTLVTWFSRIVILGISIVNLQEVTFWTFLSIPILLVYICYPFIMAWAVYTAWKLRTVDPKKSVTRICIPLVLLILISILSYTLSYTKARTSLVSASPTDYVCSETKYIAISPHVITKKPTAWLWTDLGKGQSQSLLGEIDFDAQTLDTKLGLVPPDLNLSTCVKSNGEKFDFKVIKTSFNK